MTLISVTLHSFRSQLSVQTKPQPKQSNSRQNKFLTLTRLFYEAVNALHDTLHTLQATTAMSNYLVRTADIFTHSQTFSESYLSLELPASQPNTCHSNQSSRPVTKLCL